MEFPQRGFCGNERESPEDDRQKSRPGQLLLPCLDEDLDSIINKSVRKFKVLPDFFKSTRPQWVATKYIA
jgi:hypothetical protein